MGFEIKPEAHPEQGHYYRSDHFSFARAGIPRSRSARARSFWASRRFRREAVRGVQREALPSALGRVSRGVDFSGLEQIARFATLIGIDAANAEELGRFKKGTSSRGSEAGTARIPSRR